MTKAEYAIIKSIRDALSSISTRNPDDDCRGYTKRVSSVIKSNTEIIDKLLNLDINKNK